MKSKFIRQVKKMRAQMKMRHLMARTQMLRDLLQSVVSTGGAASCFTIPKLKQMSAYDLIRVLATNHITFTLRERED
jgi:hypothetical protein